MKKRLLITGLWFYAMWYAGSLIAELFGFSPALGPILGTAAGLIIGVDPRRILWTEPAQRTEAAQPAMSERLRTPA